MQKVHGVKYGIINEIKCIRFDLIALYTETEKDKRVLTAK